MTDFRSGEPTPLYIPQEGDFVEVALQPVRGTVTINRYNRFCVSTEDETRRVMDANVFAKALEEGRVSLIEAALPKYIEGQMYCSQADRSQVYRFQPTRDTTLPFAKLFGDGIGVRKSDETVPADLVPCHVVLDKL